MKTVINDLENDLGIFYNRWYNDLYETRKWGEVRRVKGCFTIGKNGEYAFMDGDRDGLMVKVKEYLKNKDYGMKVEMENLRKDGYNHNNVRKVGVLFIR